MSKKLTIVSLAVATALSVSTGIFAQSKKNSLKDVPKHFKMSPAVKADDYLPKTIILQVNSAYRNICSVTNIDDPKLQQLLASVGAQNLAKKYPRHQPPAKEFNENGIRYADLSLIYEFNYTGDVNIEKVINNLLSTGILDYAEPHYVPKVGYTINDPQGTSTAQYNIYKIQAAGTGTTGWDISTGNSAVVIGITDTGWEPTHPDLDGNVKLNAADPINGVDDDGDGYTDNYSGWDVGENDNDATHNGQGTYYHGTHVAGTAAAEVNNSTGVAGVGFNCMFLPIKIAGAAGTLTAAYDGITYAADHGCNVINCSWGGPGGGSYGQTIITYAAINKDATVIVSAGNDGAEVVNYPANYNYVISVANTGTTDVVNGSSTYGYGVDVSAPGTNINSTLTGGGYGQLTGTSMAAPCVSGAAAIVKSYYPSYNSLQVGARLKQTADNIYGIGGNAAYINKLGKGRINLYRALTDPVAEYIDMPTKTITDNNDAAFVIGDTLRIVGDFTNYFGTTGSVTATLTASGTNLTSLDGSTTLGVINQSQIVSNTADPFQFKVNTGTPVNTVVTFTCTVTDGSYTNSFHFAVTVNVDYINITTNDLWTTATSKGKIGFNDDAGSVGLGFRYNNVNYSAEGGFMVGKSSTRVSDCVRDATTPAADFATVNYVQQSIPSVFSDFDLSGKFNDVPASPTMNLLITHKEYAWASPGNRKYVIFEYLIKNNGSVTHSNLYGGIFEDFDIDGTTYAQNIGNYDAANKMGYIYQPNSIYCGIKLLTSTAPANCYLLDNVAGGGGGVDPNTSGFVTAEKYTALSTQRLSAGPADEMIVMGSGPFSLLAGDTAKIAFALIVGDDLNDLQTSAGNAQIMYDGITLGVANAEVKENSLMVYPNPVQDLLSVDFGATIQSGTLSVYNSLGQEVTSVKVSGHKTTFSTLNLPNGNYFCRLVSENKTSVKKFVVQK